MVCHWAVPRVHRTSLPGATVSAGSRQGVDIEAQYGRVLLKAGGDERWRSIRWLVHHPDCHPVPDGDAERARLAGQPPTLDDLTGYQREVVRMRVAHLLEAETGFRGGDPLRPGPGEPRPPYDQRRTTLEQRRRAKAAELRSGGGHPIISEELREVIFAVREETKRRSKTGMQDSDGRRRARKTSAS